MRDGVTMRDPSTVYLDWTVELGADVTLEPNVILRGATSVGEGSVIGAGSQLVDSTIGERCTRLGQRRRVVGDRGRRTIGPFSHLRPGSVVGRGAEVGNFAELKNTRLGRGLEAAPHQLPRRRRGRRGRQRRRRHDHRQLRRHAASTARRSATARSSASTRCSSRRSTIGDGAEDRRRRRGDPRRARRASSPSACRPGSASRARSRPTTTRRRPASPTPSSAR